MGCAADYLRTTRIRRATRCLLPQAAGLAREVAGAYRGFVGDIALIVTGVGAAGGVGAYIVYQLALKYQRRQGNLAARQLHDLQEPQWGDVDLVESGGAWTASLPLQSDTPLNSVRLAILVNRGQAAGLHLDGDDEGAPDGLELGESATWRLRLDPHGAPTRKARVTASTGNHEWSVVIELPFSVYNWHDVTVI